MLRVVAQQLKSHAPFAAFGAMTGIGVMVLIACARVDHSLSGGLFWTFHPLHVLLGALARTAMYRLHGNRALIATVVIGYLGSVGIATLSGSLIPYFGEYLLGLPNKGVHLGFIEKWWLVNPLAAVGIAAACLYPTTKLPHAAHVLLSTWASLFHMIMALEEQINVHIMGLVAAFLFLAVRVPCCTSDIVFPLLFAQRQRVLARAGGRLLLFQPDTNGEGPAS